MQIRKMRVASLIAAAALAGIGARAFGQSYDRGFVPLLVRQGMLEPMTLGPMAPVMP